MNEKSDLEQDEMKERDDRSTAGRGSTAPVGVAILDVDGTLILSNDEHAQAFVEAAEKLGHPADYSEIRSLIGMGGDKLIPRVFGFEEDSEDGTKLSDLKGEIFRGKYLPNLKPAPGARALLERMKEDGLRLVVASSADEEDLQKLLQQAGVEDLIEDATSAGEVDDSKPEPDVVQAALKSAATKPENAVMLGDTPFDVEAANRAGVTIVGVRCGGWNDSDLAGAAAVYDHPEDLLRNYGQSPFFRG